MKTQDLLGAYRGKKVLVTGGAGFIGSNLVHALTRLGADITIIDTLNKKFGGNYRNLNGLERAPNIVVEDILNTSALQQLIKSQDFLFHFAGQINPGESNKYPCEDFQLNARGTLQLLEACRTYNREIRFLFSSSRLAVGRPADTVLTEVDSGGAKTFYGAHKAAAEEHCRLYFQLFGLRTTVLRLTNPYGERQQMRHPGYGIVAWFMRQAIENKTIAIYGTGEQLRDYIYVQDVVHAFLLAAISPKTEGKRYFCGVGSSVSLKAMAETIVQTVGSGNIAHIPWPDEEAAKETGDCTVSTSALATDTGWKPLTSFENGIRYMAEYFKNNLQYYT